MQAFEDLKQDIQTLIDTATTTITALVDQAAAQAQRASASVDELSFNSQILQLSTDVRAATDALKAQAAAVLGTPSAELLPAVEPTENEAEFKPAG